MVVAAHAVRRDPEAAAAGHRVAGVERQVQEDLLELAPVGERRRQPAAELEREVDLLAERAPQE